MAQSVAAPPDGSNAGEVIRWYRQQHNLTQQDAADMLSTTQS
ncbi:helix-turn-helix transcriptional regulator [Amycolatopsis sp. FDAARGOS 1241]|nr:helix-turn-helix transcriptional regulator [Amycolatopsis sp. FDAARGOS 1241]QRP46963.1 helix-turn-helix transcriptional regulator [Amycolatopsis sp. FDAARGOS 1241]